MTSKRCLGQQSVCPAWTGCLRGAANPGRKCPSFWDRLSRRGPRYTAESDVCQRATMPPGADSVHRRNRQLLDRSSAGAAWVRAYACGGSKWPRMWVRSRSQELPSCARLPSVLCCSQMAYFKQTHSTKPASRWLSDRTNADSCGRHAASSNPPRGRWFRDAADSRRITHRAASVSMVFGQAEVGRCKSQSRRGCSGRSPRYVRPPCEGQWKSEPAVRLDGV